MDVETWWDCDEKLRKAFNKPKDPEQSKVYFEALQLIPGPIMRLAVEKLIQDEKLWPKVATIREYCIASSKVIAAPTESCDLCHGNLWIDAEPFVENGLTYTNVVTRCPQCRPTLGGAVS